MISWGERVTWTEVHHVNRGRVVWQVEFWHDGWMLIVTTQEVGRSLTLPRNWQAISVRQYL